MRRFSFAILACVGWGRGAAAEDPPPLAPPTPTAPDAMPAPIEAPLGVPVRTEPIATQTPAPSASRASRKLPSDAPTDARWFVGASGTLPLGGGVGLRWDRGLVQLASSAAFGIGVDVVAMVAREPYSGTTLTSYALPVAASAALRIDGRRFAVCPRVGVFGAPRYTSLDGGAAWSFGLVAGAIAGVGVSMWATPDWQLLAAADVLVADDTMATVTLGVRL